MDARSAPERIGEAHLPDQPPDFRPHAWPAGTPPRFPAPEAAKTCTMPADNGFRLYDREGLQNTRRDPIQADEDHTIEVAEDRALRRPSTQHIQLMAQSEYLCLERRLRAKPPEEHPPDQVEQVTHRTFITRFGPSRQADGIYDSDSFKITEEDWRNRNKWDAYERAVCNMVDRTSTEIAPWTLVEANDKSFARVKVLKTLCERIGKAL